MQTGGDFFAPEIFRAERFLAAHARTREAKNFLRGSAGQDVRRGKHGL